MILIKAYDDTFSQTVLTRHSYTFPEFVFGARFAPAFHVDPAGGIVLDVPKVSKLLE
jgi:inward rectifier potassium channel